MVNDELLEGLKSALERGQSLQMAMMTFFNSGYKKEEIEEAARFLVGGNEETSIESLVPTYTPPAVKPTSISPSLSPASSISSKSPQIFIPVTLPLSKQAQMQQMQKPSVQAQQHLQQSIQLTKPVQKISSYESTKQKEYLRDRPVIFVLVLLLIFLFGALAFTLLFKQQIIDFISSFFG